MARIMLAWEFGSGLGQIMSLRTIGRALVARGHTVSVAARDVDGLDSILEGTGITYFQAPRIVPAKQRPFASVRGLAHVLGNIGCANPTALRSLLFAWDTLINSLRPNLIVAQHAPMLLLALHGRSTRRVNLGSGFFIPPDRFPLPSWSYMHVQRTFLDEQAILGEVNALLKSRGRPPLNQLSGFLNKVNDVILTTFSELDPYLNRPQANYYGHLSHVGGAEPIWPKGNGPRIFVYLQTCPALEHILNYLQQSGLPTLVAGRFIDAQLRNAFTGPTLRFEDRLLDIKTVAQQCDLAITHGNPGTTSGILLGGKPCLLMPIYSEQLLFAKKAEAIGAARLVPMNNGAKAAKAIQNILTDLYYPYYRDSAQVFASRYSGESPEARLDEIIVRLELLLTRRSSRARPPRPNLGWALKGTKR